MGFFFFVLFYLTLLRADGVVQSQNTSYRQIVWKVDLDRISLLVAFFFFLNFRLSRSYGPKTRKMCCISFGRRLEMSTFVIVFTKSFFFLDFRTFPDREDLILRTFLSKTKTFYLIIGPQRKASWSLVKYCLKLYYCYLCVCNYFSCDKYCY